MKTIENLVFKGGGVLGAAYVGAYQALQDARLAGTDGTTAYGNVKRVAGTSAGSIFGTLVALGHGAQAISEIMSHMNFASFADVDGDGLRKGGLCKGEKFLAQMKKIVKDTMPGSGDPTFADLNRRAQKEPRFKDLHVFSRNIDSGRLTEFSHRTTPDVPIAEAVRASMSIPLAFQPWQFSGDLQRRYPGRFIDGGVAYNYPISDFDDGENLQKTLGFFLMDMSSGDQTLLQTLLHAAEHYLGIKPDEAMVIEDLFCLCLDWVARKRLDKAKIGHETLNTLARSLPGVGIDVNGPGFVAILKLIVELAQIYCDWDTYKHDIEKIKDKIRDAAKAVGPKFSAIYEYVVTYESIVGATINPPANMVFQRDAARTVMVNSLGYSFVDFWIPDCNKDRLVKSGYNSTQAYLDLIMYS